MAQQLHLSQVDCRENADVVAGKACRLSLSATDHCGNCASYCASGRVIVYKLQVSSSSIATTDEPRVSRVVYIKRRSFTNRVTQGAKHPFEAHDCAVNEELTNPSSENVPILRISAWNEAISEVISDVVQDVRTPEGKIVQFTVVFTRAAVHYLQLHCACRMLTFQDLRMI